MVLSNLLRVSFPPILTTTMPAIRLNPVSNTVYPPLRGGYSSVFDSNHEVYTRLDQGAAMPHLVTPYVATEQYPSLGDVRIFILSLVLILTPFSLTLEFMLSG